MSLTKVTVDRIHSTDLRLSDILAMSLHQYVPEVQEVIDSAAKELKIEDRVKSIEEYWGNSALRFESHRDSDCWILTSADTLLEDLDEHFMSLQVCVCCRDNGAGTGSRPLTC